MTDSGNTSAYACPKCGNTECIRIEVDIGVGIQYGPWRCTQCGWSQEDELRIKFPKLFKDMEDPDAQNSKETGESPSPTDQM